MNVLNPEYKPSLELVATDAEWDALKATITTHLQKNAGKAVVPIADLRALDPKLDDERVWAQIASDMGLVVIPVSRSEAETVIP
jgi:hypothetical protein